MGGKKMATARNVLGKLKSSDGRIRVKTLSGVSALVAVIALLVGVLPVMANHQGQDTQSDKGIHPELVQYGGGSGACAFVDSAAEFEAHDNNPATKTLTGPDGSKINITKTGQKFSFEVHPDNPDIAVYDVVVNGGPQNLHYDYDGSTLGPQRKDGNLHAPTKNNGDLNNLSHINLCYDATTVTFVCGGDAEEAFRFGDGEFSEAIARIFTVGELSTCEKTGIFYIDNESPESNVKLDFGVEGPTVAGRLDVTKNFDDLSEVVALKYDGRNPGTFEVVPWCEIDDSQPPGVFGELDSGYPELPADGHTACKVFESVNAEWTQHTVVYFEFEDPQFR
jgi:hypothetical protein